MTGPEILGRILENCSFRFRNVLCPNKDKVASIPAATFQTDDADWSVVRMLAAAERRCKLRHELPAARSRIRCSEIGGAPVSNL
jgi:hypothetical protein